MTAKRRSSVDALERAKLDALKELAYGASHEINNPLANISARAQSLLRDEADPERRRALEAIHQQALRAHEMIADLMLFARPPKLQRATIDVAKLIANIAAELAGECRRREIELHAEVDADLPVVMADEVQLAVAVKALCSNAIEALGRGGWVKVRAECRGGDGKSDRGVVRIEVSDNGPGVAELIRPYIFDPFFSGREAGRGLGFGLSKCWRIVTEHGGKVTVANRTDGGAKFTIELPAGGQD